MSKTQFFKLVELFGQAYEDIFGESLESSQEQSTQESTLKTYADLLFFGLYSFKSGLTYDLLDLSFGLSSSNAYQNQSLVIRVLETTLGRHGHMPKRMFHSEKEFKEYLSGHPSILIDVTEHKTQRPGNQDDQKGGYSGKKSAHPEVFGNIKPAEADIFLELCLCRLKPRLHDAQRRVPSR